MAQISDRSPHRGCEEKREWAQTWIWTLPARRCTRTLNGPGGRMTVPWPVTGNGTWLAWVEWGHLGVTLRWDEWLRGLLLTTKRRGGLSLSASASGQWANSIRCSQSDSLGPDILTVWLFYPTPLNCWALSLFFNNMHYTKIGKQQDTRSVASFRPRR